jgi:hypothetical protein
MGRYISHRAHKVLREKNKEEIHFVDLNDKFIFVSWCLGGAFFLP